MIEDEFFRMRAEATRIISEALKKDEKSEAEMYLSGYLFLMLSTEREIRRTVTVLEKEIKKLNKALNELLREIKKLNSHFEKMTKTQENILFYAEKTYEISIKTYKNLDKSDSDSNEFEETF